MIDSIGLAKRLADLFETTQSNEVEPGTRGTIVPAAKYSDGEYHLAWPGLIAAPFEGFNRMWERGDEANIANPEALAANSADSFDAGGGAMAGSLVSRAAPVGARIGADIADHATARYLDWKHPAEMAQLPPGGDMADAAFMNRSHGLGDNPSFANDTNGYDAAVRGQNREAPSLGVVAPDASPFTSQMRPADGASVTLDRLYDGYTNWAQGQNFPPMSSESFHSSLIKQGMAPMHFAGKPRVMGYEMPSLAETLAGQ